MQHFDSVESNLNQEMIIEADILRNLVKLLESLIQETNNKVKKYNSSEILDIKIRKY
mgnify:CR=1 FL=1